MTAALLHVVVVAAAGAAATATSAHAHHRRRHYHHPMALFSNGVIIPKQHWQLVDERRSSSRRDRIRPCPGWHPCAELRDDGSSSSSGSNRFGDSSTTAIIDDFAKSVDEASTRSSSTSSLSRSSFSSSIDVSIGGGGNKINRNISNNETNDIERIKQSQLAAILILLTVPAAWGTYAPAVKFIYDVADSNQPSMPGLVFSAGYYCVAAVTLGMLSIWKDSRHARDDDASMTVDEEDKLSSSSSLLSKSATEEVINEFLFGGGGGGGEMHKETNINNEEEREITSRGGWELGSYLFIGNALQVAGLQTVPADRAAFLVQLTTVMVPLLSAFSAGELSAVSLKTWAACAIAFAGVVVMGADNDDSGSDASSSDAMLLDLTNSGSNDDTYASQLSHLLHTMSGGDILIVLAALAYSMHVLRLGAYAPRTAPLRLAASKAKAETAFSVSVVLLLAYIGGGVGSGGGGTNAVFSLPEFIVQSGEDVSKYLSWLSSDRNVIDSLVPSIGAILWTGWVTCAYTIYAQSFGQRRVNATNANLIYATQPLFTSLFAYFLLGETLGPNGYVGAALIGTALWLVST